MLDVALRAPRGASIVLGGKNVVPEGYGVLDSRKVAKSEHYRYDLDFTEITEVWRRGSVIAS